MVTIGGDPNGRKRILFIAPGGKRKMLRLGKVPMRLAEAVKVRVERLVASIGAGLSPDDEAARWLQAVDVKMRERLEAVGLVESLTHGRAATLLDEFFAAAEIKPGARAPRTARRSGASSTISRRPSMSGTSPPSSARSGGSGAAIRSSSPAPASASASRPPARS